MKRAAVEQPVEPLFDAIEYSRLKVLGGDAGRATDRAAAVDVASAEVVRPPFAGPASRCLEAMSTPGAPDESGEYIGAAHRAPRGEGTPRVLGSVPARRCYDRGHCPLDDHLLVYGLALLAVLLPHLAILRPPPNQRASVDGIVENRPDCVF